MRKLDDLVSDNSDTHSTHMRYFADALIESLKEEIRREYHSKELTKSICEDIDLAYKKIKEG